MIFEHQPFRCRRHIYYEVPWVGILTCEVWSSLFQATSIIQIWIFKHLHAESLENMVPFSQETQQSLLRFWHFWTLILPTCNSSSIHPVAPLLLHGILASSLKKLIKNLHQKQHHQNQQHGRSFGRLKTFQREKKTVCKKKMTLKNVSKIISESLKKMHNWKKSIAWMVELWLSTWWTQWTFSSSPQNTRSIGLLGENALEKCKVNWVN